MITPIHPDSYETVPPQNCSEYEKIDNSVDEAENVCYDDRIIRI